MLTELQYLISAVGLYFVMIVMQAVAAVLSRKASVGELVGARDAMPPAGLSPLHARTRRAQANMTEGMVMFVPLILTAVHTGELSIMTSAGAAAFFYGRLAFAPLYYFGVPWLRTLAWFVSIIGLLMIFLELIT